METFNKGPRVKDPRWTPVQLSFRLPFWYREQLEEEAMKAGVSMPTFVLQAIQKVYKPKEL